jgi:pseudaminic acid synthase
MTQSLLSSSVCTPEHQIFIIAELSANHNNSLERAEAIVRAAADAGADAVKLQTYTADTLTIPCDNEYFRIKGTLWEGRTLYDLYQEAYTPWEWMPHLMALAGDLGLDCFSTPFDSSAVDFLEGCGISRYKIASFEAIDISLLQKVAATGKPVIMSTGMATLAEIDEAVRTLRANGTDDLTLLKCTSAYPAPPEEINLLTIPHLAQAFSCPVGLSDHTLGSAVAVAAVALGANVIEKHFTLSRADGGPDSAFSMEPEEFKQMVHDIRTVEKALGRVSYNQTGKEKESAVFRRSLFVVKDIKQGELFTVENVRSIRPGYGLHPRYLAQVIGRRSAKDIFAGTPLGWDLLR